MAAKRKTTAWWKIAVFVGLVVISGYALNTSGYFDNPFTTMSELSQESAMDNLLERGGPPLAASSDSAASDAAPILSASANDTTSSDAPLMSASDNANVGAAPDLSALSQGDDDEQGSVLPFSEDDESDEGAITANSQDNAPTSDQGAILSARGSRPQGDFGRPGGEGQETVRWSEIGDVLFDVWFLFAAAAVFIVLQQFYQVVKLTFSRKPTIGASA